MLLLKLLTLIRINYLLRIYSRTKILRIIRVKEVTPQKILTPHVAPDGSALLRATESSCPTRVFDRPKEHGDQNLRVYTRILLLCPWVTFIYYLSGKATPS